MSRLDGSTPDDEASDRAPASDGERASASRRDVLVGVSAGAMALAAPAASAARAGAVQGKKKTVKMLSKGGAKYFDPVGLFVEPGDTVTFVNESGRHSSTSYTGGNPNYSGPRLIPTDAAPWNSGVLSKPGATFTHTFETKGTYLYYCIPHRALGMVGKIVCGQPGGPGEKKQIPTSDEPQGVMPPSKKVVSKKTIDWPYVPNEGHGGPPALFWAGTLAFVGTSVYLFSAFDRASGRYRGEEEEVVATGEWPEEEEDGEGDENSGDGGEEDEGDA